MTPRPFLRATPAPRALLMATLAAASALAGCSRTPPKADPPPVPVLVTTLVTASVPVTLAANGVVEPLQSVAIQPLASGAITKVLFTEGDEVAAGAPLFEIDPRPYRAALAQAVAQLARDRAQATAARNDAARYTQLLGQGYVTPSQADQSTAAAAALAATVQADEAMVAQARLALAYTTITAPIAGRTGGLQVRLGNVVRVPNAVPLVTIVQVAPVHVRFPVTDRMLAAVRAAQGTGRPLAVRTAADTGALDFLDNGVDTTTGTILLKARFANAARRLWPGAWLPVTMELGRTPHAAVVPGVAVLTGPRGSYVFAVEGGRAAQVGVHVARTVGGLAVLDSAPPAGTHVVVDGMSRLMQGTRVVVKGEPPLALPPGVERDVRPVHAPGDVAAAH